MKAIIFLLFLLPYSAFASDVYVRIDCDSYVDHGLAHYLAPEYDFFRRLDEDDLCDGGGSIMSDVPIPYDIADEIVRSDPTQAFSIVGSFQLNPIIVEADIIEPGSNPFSVPWNWLVRLFDFNPDDDVNESYDLSDIPSCDPNSSIIEYKKYSEIA